MSIYVCACYPGVGEWAGAQAILVEYLEGVPVLDFGLIRWSVIDFTKRGDEAFV